MRTIFVVLTLALAGVLAGAVENQAFLGIFAETHVQRIAGMPVMEMPAMPNMPGMPAMAFPGVPVRSLNVRLWSPGLAPKDAVAAIAVPAGLKQGATLNLELYRPKAEEGTTAVPSPNAGGKFTIKIYWGSSATVKANQPKIITWDTLSPDQQREMKRAAEAAKTSSYFYKPDWTTGYWPTKRQPGRIDKDASLRGTYSLTTNYTGNIALDAPAGVDFLAPIELASPDFSKTVPLDGAMTLEWKQIPNLLGGFASVFGMEGKDTMVIWSSSEKETGAMGGSFDYMQMADVRRMVEETVFMKPEQTKAIVPAGIFKTCDMAMLNMVGFGPGAALGEGAQPLPRIQTKTTLSGMLSAKGMPGM